MMWKGLILCAVILLPVLLYAQNAERIKGDPSYIWAEGWGSRPTIADDAALDGLVRKLAATGELQVENAAAVWRTYLPDIRNCSEQQTLASGVVLRYIAWMDIPSIFDSRWRKVRELTQSALQAEERGDKDAARTYCDWATVYLMSLPALESDLRDRVVSLRRRLGAGRTDAVRMRNVETEVAGIRVALGIGDRTAQRAPTMAAATKDNDIVPASPPVRPAWDPLPELPDLSRLCQNYLCAPSESLRPPSTPPGEETFYPVRDDLPRWQWSVFAVADIGRVPAWGFAVSCFPGRFGGYLSIRSNFVDARSDYRCRSDGTTDYGFIWASGLTRGSRLSISCGGMVRLADFMRLHVGTGFGAVSVLWGDTSGLWARVTDLSVQGMLLETGLLFDFGRLSAGAGVSSIRFKEWSSLVCFGISF